MEWCMKNTGSLGLLKKSPASPPMEKWPAACRPRKPSSKRPWSSFWKSSMDLEAGPRVTLYRFSRVSQPVDDAVVCAELEGVCEEFEMGTYEIALQAPWVVNKLFSDFDLSGHGWGVGTEVGLQALGTLAYI
jgi:hypothetical protein